MCIDKYVYWNVEMWRSGEVSYVSLVDIHKGHTLNSGNVSHTELTVVF